MKRRNQYISQLGVSRRIYGGNFIIEKKPYRMCQRYRYGFDYRDIFNMDMSFAEWLYSHMRMYKDNSVHDDTMATVTFNGKEYTIQEAVDWIIENTGEFIRYGYYLDTHFDYITRYPLIGEMMSKFNPAVRTYLQEYEWLEDNECQITDNFIKAGGLFIEIMQYCWL